MEKYIPDIYQKSIYTIDYDKLYKHGIKCLLFDLDNTLIPVKCKEISKKLIALFNRLKDQGFRLIIFSNNSKNKLKNFKETLDVDCCARAFKPYKKKFLMILNTYKYNENEVAIIGDQMCTDILGGNNIGITTILVNPMSKKDLLITKFNRLREKIIMKRLRSNNLFVKGRYYE